MLPVGVGTVSFQGPHKETEYNDKTDPRSQVSHTKPLNWGGATEPTSSQLPSK